MSEELGRITRPEAGQFRGERKLYLVPLLFAGEKSPPEYVERFELYWQQVEEQLSTQEQKIGRISHVYHESVALGGEEGLKLLEKLSPPSYRIVRDRCDRGAALEFAEEAEIADECLDWERCLMLGFLSRAVAEKVAGYYREAVKKRWEQMARRIDETLGENEVAVLFIREGHAVQFPGDIQVFSVAPPALDAVHRWLRERSSRPEPEQDYE